MSPNRCTHNPLITPGPNIWESYAVFNPSIIEVAKGKWAVLYRAEGQKEKVLNHELRVSRIGLADSREGIHFENRRVFIEPQVPWDRFGCEDPRVTFFEGTYYTFYTALGGFPFSAENIRVGVAVSDDLKNIKSRHLVTPFNAKAMVLFPERINGLVTVAFTVNTDDPPAYISIAQFEKIEDLWNPHMWYRWRQDLHKYILPVERINTDHVEVGASPILTDRGWLLIYSHIQNYQAPGVEKVFGVEGLLLDRHDPFQIKSRTLNPLLVPTESYEKEGTVPNVIFPTSTVHIGNEVRIYYGGADTNISMAHWDMSEFWQQFSSSQTIAIKASKVHYALLEPRPEKKWEENGVFNPGIWDDGQKIHMLYRAQSDVWTSTMGYACLEDPWSLSYRSEEPIYQPRADFEMKIAGSGYSGCEDARLVEYHGQIYMTYTAFDGVNPPRVALSKISTNDFKMRRWDHWSFPVLISPPGIMDKNSFLFPEKVNGKFAFIHRMNTDIFLDFVDDLSFDGKKFLKGQINLAMPHGTWDGMKIGAGAPPFKTESGWLLLYHGVDNKDRQYRSGAMLLDLKDPTKILARTRYPILEPEFLWEKMGVVNNVVFPCGAALRSGTLHLYYGGADFRIGVASIDLSRLLAYMES